MKNYTEFLAFCIESLLEISKNELYLVGGLIRDRLLGINSYDYDFVVTNNAISITKKMANITKGVFVELDNEHDIARVAWNKNRLGFDLNFDIAKMAGETIQDDSLNRDLSINSFILKIQKQNINKIIDINYIFSKDELIYQPNSYNDINNKVIRVYKKENIEQDPLRLLRIFRFSSKLDFQVEKQTLDFAKELSHLIQKPSKERILKEFCEILKYPNSHKHLKLMEETNLLQNLFVNLINSKIDFSKAIEKLEEFENIIKELKNNFAFYLELENYLLEKITQEHNRLILLKISLIFYHIKPININYEEYMIFVEKFLILLTFSNQEKKIILKQLENYLLPNDISNLDLSRKKIFKLFKQLTKKEVLGTLLLSYVENNEKDNWEIKEKILKLFDLFLNDKLLSEPPKIINGNDLKKYFNIVEGKLIGELLSSIEEAQAEKKIVTFDDAIEFSKKYF